MKRYIILKQLKEQLNAGIKWKNPLMKPNLYIFLGFLGWAEKKLKCNCQISISVSCEAWVDIRFTSLCRNPIWVPTPGCAQHIPVTPAGAQSIHPTSPRAAFPASWEPCILLSLPGGDPHTTSIFGIYLLTVYNWPQLYNPVFRISKVGNDLQGHQVKSLNSFSKSLVVRITSLLAKQAV